MTAADPQQGETPRTNSIISDWTHWQEYRDLALQLERELAASRSAALEEAAKTVEMNAVNLNALGWPKELMPLQEKFYGKDAVAATYAAAIRALKGNAAPQVNRPGEPSGNRAGE